MSARRRILLVTFMSWFFVVESALIAAARQDDTAKETPAEPPSTESAPEAGESEAEPDTTATPPDGDGGELPAEVSDEDTATEFETDTTSIRKPKPRSAGAAWSVSAGIRNIIFPKGIIEVFVERASSGINGVGTGLEVTRRKGGFELVLGVNWDHFGMSDGIWIEKGQSIPMDQPDYVEFDKFSWLTFDFKVVWRTDITDFFALRYGAGLGLGIPLGSVLRSDYICTTSDPNSCNQLPGGQMRVKEDDIPPVFPAIHAMIGMQFRPYKNLIINIDGGIRTMFYWGGSVGWEF